ncbi:MAG: hypothetical protein R3Y04_05615 [Rikenellaceae bacterium]
MNIKTRGILSFILVFTLALNNLFAADIKQILDDLKGQKGLIIEFKSNDIAYTIKSLDAKYTLKSTSIDILYDGEDLYTYNRENNELTIERLSSQNIMTNPTLIFDLDNAQFLFKTNGDIHTITPKDIDQIGLEKIIIETAGENSIKSISLFPISSDEIKLDITSLKKENNIDTKEFKYNKSNYPNAEIIDFR